MQTIFLRLGPSQIAAAVTGAAVVFAATVGTSAQDKKTIIVGETGTPGIEGPAIDADDNLYFVTRKGLKDGKILQLKPGAKKSEVYAVLTEGRLGNGIRFDKDGRMYVADFQQHNVLVFEKGQKKANVYFTTNHAQKGAPTFNQPNDLAIGNDGILYASDPLRKTGLPISGQIWRITREANGKGKGQVMTSDRKDGKMGATNGIDLSPDGKTLYVGESTTGQIWAYRIEGNNLISLTGPTTPMTTLTGGELDGMRTDTSGQIYVTHNGGGKITVLTPQGVRVREIATQGSGPSNLTFGGPDGKTVFVTQTKGGFIESFTVDIPGREPCPQQKSATVCSGP
jgi:sugar lactone lactonase YvrE